MKILHPGFDRLRAFSAGELAGATRRRVAAHLAGCAACRREITFIRDVRGAAAEAPEVTLPEAAWAKIEQRIGAGEELILPSSPPVATRGASGGVRIPRVLGRAAAFVALGAGIASAAIPGSPVREWWSRRDQPEAVVSRNPAPGPPEAAREAPIAVSGMAVSPVRAGVRISLERPDPSLRIRVRLTDAPLAEVAAHGAAAGALLRTAPGRIDVVGAGSGELRVDLPRELERAILLVDGVVYLRKDGPRIEILAPSADTTGAEFVLGVHR